MPKQNRNHNKHRIWQMRIGKLDCYRACFSPAQTPVRKSIDCGKLFGKITHLVYGFCFWR